MRKSKLREYQDAIDNAGWRIKTIPHDDPSRPMLFPANWFALAGLAVLLGSIWFFFREKKQAYLWVAAGGFVFMGLSVFFVSLSRRRHWMSVQARCIDRETAQAGRREWHFRLCCQFELAGKTHTVTPKAFWRSFDSDDDIQRFFSKVIKPDGTCYLHVNPKNPLETELMANDILDKLLHR